MEVVDRVVQSLDVTSEQAEGGVGAVLFLAEHRLDRPELTRVADAIPGFSDLVRKSPIYDASAVGWFASLCSQLVGGAGGLRPLIRPFAALGLPRSIVANYVAIVLQYVGQRGGREIEHVLREVLR